MQFLAGYDHVMCDVYMMYKYKLCAWFKFFDTISLRSSQKWVRSVTAKRFKQFWKSFEKFKNWADKADWADRVDRAAWDGWADRADRDRDKTLKKIKKIKQEPDFKILKLSMTDSGTYGTQS